MAVCQNLEMAFRRGSNIDISLLPSAEEHLLLEQTKDIREVAVYVSQLRRAGQGLGFFEVHSPADTLHGHTGLGMQHCFDCMCAPDMGATC